MKCFRFPITQMLRQTEVHHLLREQLLLIYLHLILKIAWRIISPTWMPKISYKKELMHLHLLLGFMKPVVYWAIIYKKNIQCTL